MSTAYTTNFYNVDVNGTLTQDQVIGNGSALTLAGTLVTGDLGTIGVPRGAAPGFAIAILFKNGLLKLDEFWQQNYLLHELLHAFGEGDDAVFRDFASMGLVKPTDGTTAAITRWISTDCWNTPPPPI